MERQAGVTGTAVGRALRAVVEVDRHTADALARVEVPASMQARVDEIMSRLTTGAPLDGFLAWGADGARLGQLGLKGTSVLNKFRALATGDYPELLFGQANGGMLRHFIGSPAARVAGKAFLPLTVASGVVDVATGGGYEGGRAWAARGFGLAGATGAVGLMAAGGMLGTSAAGVMIAAGPVGLGVAGAAVVGYGAWQLGNLVYDHHEAIGRFATTTVEWTGDTAVTAWDATSGAVSEATDWAGERLADASGAVADLGKKVLPDVDLPDLNPF